MGGYLPNMNAYSPDVTMIREFRGYNHNLVIGNGEFYQQENISSDAYPLLTCRPRRMQTYYVNNPHSMIAADHMAWIGNGEFYYNGDAKFAVEEISPGDNTQMVRMGAYICIFPHGIVYNTKDGTWEHIAIENSVAKNSDGTSNGVLRDVYPTVDATGQRVWNRITGTIFVSETEPETTEDGAWWLRTSVSPRAYYKYSAAQQMWVSMPITYLAIAADGLADGLKEGDGITINGLENDGASDLAYLNGSYTIEGTMTYGTAYGGTYVIISAPYPPLNYGVTTFNANLSVSRSFPQMDFVCEMGNRLYGCSSENHEVYASKLGDPLNWNVYQGVSTDSYAATVGSHGNFTGCIGYRDSVLFFKEDRIHILSGTRPATFQIDTLECNGVERMSSKSLAIVNETLFYKASDGFYAYSGGLPQHISDALGDDNDGNVIAAGGDGTKYYACQVIGDDNVQTVVYDTRRGFWNREDGGAVLSFTLLEGYLYMLKADGMMWAVDGYSITEDWQILEMEKPVQWSATTGMIGLDSPFGKYISDIRIRAQVDAGSVLRVLIAYDEKERYEEMARINGHNTRSEVISIIPQRCDTMRIRFEGRGAAKVFSLSYQTEQGGEV